MAFGRTGEQRAFDSGRVLSRTPPVTGDGAVPPAEERKAGLEDFHGFYLEHVDFVRRLMTRLLGPGAHVDDGVQDVFLVAFRRRGEFEGRSKASTWLYGIATRTALSIRRRGRWRSVFGLDSVTERAEETTPERLFENREASIRLYEMLNRISEAKRTVFILYELEGLSGEQIAELLGCPVKTVWTRLYHARRELQALAYSSRDRSPT